MLEGIQGLKLLEEDYYYSLSNMGFLLLFAGILVSISGLALIGSEYDKVWNIIFGIVVIIGLSLIINSFIFEKVEHKKYTLTPIEESYYIDLNKYAIDNEKSNNNLIVIRDKYESEED